MTDLPTTLPDTATITAEAYWRSEALRLEAVVDGLADALASLVSVFGGFAPTLREAMRPGGELAHLANDPELNHVLALLEAPK